MARAPELNFSETDFAIARQYVAKHFHAAAGAKLEQSGLTLTNPKSGSTYSISLCAGRIQNCIMIPFGVDGIPVYGGATSWCAALDAETSELYMMAREEIAHMVNVATANGGVFQGFKVDAASNGYVLTINCGWAEASQFIKRTYKLGKSETFKYFRGLALSKPEQFVHLHAHSYFSLLDGVASPEDLVKQAKLNGQPGIAITDHGSMYGTFKFWKAGKDHGVKTLLGVEAYMVDDDKINARYTDTKGNVRRFEYHQTLIAMNQEGWENLCYLISVAGRDHYYYVPRISHSQLFARSAGIFCLSGCFKGMVAHYLQHYPVEVTAEAPWYRHDPDLSRRIAQRYHEVFGDRYGIEVHSNDFPRYMDAVPRIMELADHLGIPKYIANDAHYTEAHDAVLQRLLTRINNQRVDELGEGMQATGPYYLKCIEEITHPLFTPDMYSRTCELMERCNLSLEHKGYLFPSLNLEEDADWQAFVAAGGK